MENPEMGLTTLGLTTEDDENVCQVLRATHDCGTFAIAQEKFPAFMVESCKSFRDDKAVIQDYLLFCDHEATLPQP